MRIEALMQTTFKRRDIRVCTQILQYVTGTRLEYFVVRTYVCTFAQVLIFHPSHDDACINLTHIGRL